jgi:hypothetical protein
VLLRARLPVVPQAGGPGVPQFNAALGGGTAIAFRAVSVFEPIADATFTVVVSAYALALRVGGFFAAAPREREAACAGGAAGGPGARPLPIAFRLPARRRVSRPDLTRAVDWVALGHAAHTCG